jgi:hypothetical protein
VASNSIVQSTRCNVLANDIFNVGHEIQALFAKGGVGDGLRKSYERIQASSECIEIADNSVCEESDANTDFLDCSGANSPTSSGTESQEAKKDRDFQELFTHPRHTHGPHSLRIRNVYFAANGMRKSDVEI